MVKRCREDLVSLEDTIRWARSDGYQRSNAERPRRLPPPSSEVEKSEGPDVVHAPRFDLGIGNHRARAALGSVVPAMVKAEAHLMLAVHLAGVKPQPRRVQPTREAGPAVLLDCVTACRERVQLLDGAGLDRAAWGQLEAGYRQVDRAWRLMASVFDRGPTEGVATAEPMCRICKARPVAEKAGGRCHTCKSWRDRNGHERPAKLDAGTIGAARAAKARRTARGEGWGDESFSAVVQTRT